jgi:thymidylate synthase
MDYVVDALVKEPTSRRAVLTIWRENPPPSRDTPCTISVQFLLRDGYLNELVYMRSSDTWLGLPYDLFTFTMVAATVYLKLRDKGLDLRGLGRLTNIAGSRHLYQQDVEKIRAKNFLDDPGATNTVTTYPHFDPDAYVNAEALLDHLWAVARCERQNLRSKFISDLTIKETA